MFGWLFKKRDSSLEEQIKQSFASVKDDMDLVGKWIKHLDQKDKQLFDGLEQLKQDISSVRDELASMREGISEVSRQEENKQLFENLPVLNKQTPVFDVQEDVQTPVQTGKILDILKNLSSNERLLIFTLMNSDLKLSYEDLALLVGKERSTVRGQINSIRQKAQGIIEEISEKNGKKRVYIPDEIKEKLSKYGKVRVKQKKKFALTEER